MKNFNFKWLLLSIILSVAGISQVWAWTISSGVVYFDDTNTNWASGDCPPRFVGEKSDGCAVFAMTAILNTKLYHWTGTWGEGKVSNLRFASGTYTSGWYGWGDYEKSFPDLVNNKSDLCTYTNTYGVDINNSTKLFYAASASNNAGLTKTDLDNGYSALNYTQTLEQKLSDDGGSTYATCTLALASTVKVSSYYLSDATTASSTGDQAISSGNSSTTCSAARTATVTYTVSGVQSGYDFVGWYDGDTEKSTSNTYTYEATGAKTITARFKVHQYTVNYGVYENARHGSVTLNSFDAVKETDSKNINTGTSLSFTATPKTGYSVVGWYSDAACTSQLQPGGTSYSAGTLSENTTVYVKFTGAMRLVAGTGGEVSSDNLNWKSIDTVKNIRSSYDANMYAQASTGYVFRNWTTEATGTIKTNAVHGTYTPDSYDDVELTANFTETMHEVTVEGGTSSDDEVGIATSVTVTADAAEEGKKFKNWTIRGIYTLQGGTTETSRVIQITAVSDVTLTANYEDRAKKKVYFATPSSGWSSVYAYAWEEASKVGENPSNKNAGWHGVDITANTETIAGVTYNYYEYYIDNDNEATPDDKTDQNRWDKIIFNNNSGTQTATLNIADGHYYHKEEDASSTGSPYPEDWYVMGTWNNVSTWDYSHPIRMNEENVGSAIVKNLTAGVSQAFKIYKASTDGWYRFTGTGYDDMATDTEYTLTSDNGSNDAFTPDETAAFSFTVDNSGASPVLTIHQLTDINCSVIVTAAAHGSITTDPSTIHQYVSTAIEATANTGYNFKNWTVDAAHSAYITFDDATNRSTNVYATGPEASGAVITANFTNEGFVYLDLSHVYGSWGAAPRVTYFNSTGWSWHNENKGLIVCNWLNDDVHNQPMTSMGNNLYCFYTSRTPEGKILFVSGDHGGENYVLQHLQAAERGDFNVGRANLFVVESGYTSKSAMNSNYYVGYWMKYEEETPGVKLCIYNGSHEHIYGSPFTLTKDDSGNFTTTVKLNASATYKIELLGDNGTYYKNRGTISGNVSDWEYLEREKTVGCINTASEGEYTFTLTCSNQLKLRVQYPLEDGDYRIVYNGKINTQDGTSAADHASYFISKWTSGTQTDKVSFFVTDAVAEGMDWNLRVQSYDASSSDWEDVGDEITFSDLNGKTGVYTFDVTQTAADEIEISSNPELYDGDYYIRTDKADGGWESYKEAPDNRMVYSDYDPTYNYYHCHYIPSGKNVKFVVANDYSSNLTGELKTDTYVSDSEGNLSANANVRFMYNSSTNSISRAYIGGSSEDTYLNIVAPTAATVYSSDGLTDLNPAAASARKFTDLGNWVYQLDIQAVPGATAKITAQYGVGEPQYFIGTSTTSKEIIGGSGSTKYSLRAVYDFKTNHLLTAWRPSALENNLAINADVMLIRNHQSAAQQILLNSYNLSNVKTVYGVMEFNKWTVNGKNTTEPHGPTGDSQYERDLFWISFPFEVNLRNVFGFGTYGTHWIIEYYDGKGRARNGFWADSPSNWKFVTPAMRENGNDGNGYILQANTGYILALDLDMLTEASSVWDNTETVSLYFPSTKNVGNITTKSVNVEIDTVGYTCTINRGTAEGNRTIKDSHWHCIGAPSFANISHAATTGWVVDGKSNPDYPNVDDWKTNTLLYVYSWNSTSNTLTPVSAANHSFAAMNSYLVQYSQKYISWTNATTPSSVAARKSEISNLEFRLALQRDDEMEDQTFIRLTDDEAVTPSFEFNYDLCKEFNGGKANVYTIIDNYLQAAANCQPLSKTASTIVPVGVKVVANGEYTLAMPEGTNGEDVYLIDNAYGTRTNLGLMPYTVTLTAGTYDSRFALEFGPIQDSPTSLENDGLSRSDELNDANDDVRKVFVGGRLYIIRDGKVYDAAGQRVE